MSKLDRDLQHSLNLGSEVYEEDEIYDGAYTSNHDSDLDDIRDDYCAPLDDSYPRTKSYYVVLRQDDLIQRQQDEIKMVTSFLSISKDDACMLLLKCNWSVSNVLDAWSEDKVEVRNAIGMVDVDPNLKFPKEGDQRIVECGICFDSFTSDKTANCGCGHIICRVCWRSYVSAAINEKGIGCLTVKCPEPSCGATVGPDMVKVLAKVGDIQKYYMFWLRSYVESNKKIRWCPGPGCECAIEFDYESYDADNYDVTCDCKHVFCWRCVDSVEDAHRPVECETARKWVISTNKVDKSKQQLELARSWDANEKSRKRALLEVHKIETEYIKKLSLNYGVVETMLQFITDAWLQIVECRRVLKWTYVYGYYYIPTEGKMEQMYFEVMLRQAKDVLETLLHCAEQTYIKNEDAEAITKDNFDNFRMKLINLTSVTRSYFQNFVRALEDGLFAA